jgi:hypothetical protein
MFMRNGIMISEANLMLAVFDRILKGEFEEEVKLYKRRLEKTKTGIGLKQLRVDVADSLKDVRKAKSGDIIKNSFNLTGSGARAINTRRPEIQKRAAKCEKELEGILKEIEKKEKQIK